MKTTIFLTNQAPRIGSGMRIVEVIRQGYKWITVRYWPGGHGAAPINQKFRKSVWDGLRKQETTTS